MLRRTKGLISEEFKKLRKQRGKLASGKRGKSRALLKRASRVRLNDRRRGSRGGRLEK